MYVGELLKGLDRLPTGVPGLDNLIGGGFLPGRVYLITGPPGAERLPWEFSFLLKAPTTTRRASSSRSLKRRTLSYAICSATTSESSNTFSQRR